MILGRRWIQRYQAVLIQIQWKQSWIQKQRRASPKYATWRNSKENPDRWYLDHQAHPSNCNGCSGISQGTPWNHVNKLINAKQVHHLITDLARAAYKQHAAAALESFAETDKPDDDRKEIKKNTKKSDEIKTTFPTASWNLKEEVNESQEFADKYLLQEPTNMISKNLNKFEVNS